MAHLLTGALLAWSAPAHAATDLGRVIFEVAPIPVDAAVPAPGNGAGNGVANGTGAADLVPAGMADTNLTIDADIRAYRERIGDTQANENPYSAALREQYDALGTLLQQSGEHEDAIAVFESAMHIDRVNGGLYTLDQIPLVERIIASHEALGNSDEVNDFHGYLFYLQQKTFAEGDPRLLAAKEDWADWNVESWLRERGNDASSMTFAAGPGLSSRPDYVAVQNRDGSFSYVSRMDLLRVLSPAASNAAITDFMMSTNAYSVDAEEVVDERLRTARTQYEEIVEAKTTEAGAAAPADDHRVERKLANVAYAVKEQIESMELTDDVGSLYNNRILEPRTPPRVVTRGYQDNRDLLEGIATKLEQDPAATAMQKALAWIDLGDWHTGFDHTGRGEDAYRKAWELLSGTGMDETAINAVLMPQPLVPAPGFATHAYSRAVQGIGLDETIAYDGYFDMTLSVNRNGDVYGINVDVANPEAPADLRRALLDFLREQKMRPAVVNGDTVKRDDISLRYYYRY